MCAIHRKLLRWFDAEKRDLPWRKTRDPYAIWVSEIMLQQTQVATVIPYYERWMQRFPDVGSLAVADTQEVLSAWQGLGYYRRCRHLQEGARFVAERRLPRTAEDWKKVPGVGRYTAGAIASIASGERAPLVDGNVERVFARLTGNRSSGKELHDAAWQWATEMLDAKRPGDWNQALMELGACVCKPATPNCESCPLRKECTANRESSQSLLPIRSQKPSQKKREEIVWIPYHSDSYGVRQIPDGEWWHGMWEFPRERSSDLLKIQMGEGSVERAGAITYHVTNHRIRMEAFLFRCDSRLPNLHWVNDAELNALPMPSPQRKALKLAQQRLLEPTLMPELASSR